MKKSILTCAQNLINQGRLQEAAHALEFLLTNFPDDYSSRFALAQIYIRLKENNFRAKAREHLEKLIPIVSSDSLAQVLRLIIFNVYLTNGPVNKARELIEKYHTFFSENDLYLIRNKIEELDNYTKIKIGGARRSVMPENISDFEIFENAVDRFIFNDFKEKCPKLKSTSKFFTFGSCFAGNVAREMRRQGIEAESFWVGEEVNTTFSNVNLVKYILGDKEPHYEYYKSLLKNLDVIELKNKLINSDAVIFTLGVSPAFFNANNEYVPHSTRNLKNILQNKDISYRMSSVSENLSNLDLLKLILLDNTAVKRVFLTVSPVPIAASLISSATPVDDSESKSILRSAAGEACRSSPDFFIYFPSYEAFRWLPCFRNQPGFGMDDGSTRHVNTDMVSKVVLSFIEAAGLK